MALEKTNCIEVDDLTFQEMISASEIQQRIDEIAAELKTRYDDKTPIFIGILSGAFMFMADLIRAVNVPCDIAFVKLSSYDGLQSTGNINVELDLDLDITDRHLVITEDIIDTGRTLRFFLDRLEKHQPASVSLVTLLEKPQSKKFDVQADIIGFSIPDQFVIGYGLDYNGKCRQLPAIYSLVENVMRS